MENEDITTLIHNEATKHAELTVEKIHQDLEDSSHEFIVNEFEGNDDKETEQLKEIYKEKFLEELQTKI